jgi:hypothetical protein
MRRICWLGLAAVVAHLAIVSLIACSKRSETVTAPGDRVVDITELGRAPAGRDVAAVLRFKSDSLDRCADLVRHVVRERQSEIGFGKVGVTLEVAARRGSHLQLTTLDVEPVFTLQPEYSLCVQFALNGGIPVVASADYRLQVRVHLHVQQDNATAAAKTEQSDHGASSDGLGYGRCSVCQQLGDRAR